MSAGHIFTFPCPSCGRPLEAPGQMAGLYVECPACTEVIQIPAVPLPPLAVNQFRPPTAAVEMPKSPKKDTIPLDLPPNLGVPEPRHRHIVIRRTKDGE